MLLLILLLIPVSFATAWPVVFLMRWVGRRAGLLDGVGSEGHEKVALRGVPNTGGVGLVAGIFVPIVFGLVWLRVFGFGFLGELGETLSVHLDGIDQQTPMIGALLCCVFVLHVMGLFDDRRPMNPWMKLVIQAAASFVMVYFFDSRLLTLLDGVPGLASVAPWPSVIVSVIWLVVVINAINFMDNMDGLAGTVAAIASALFLTAACLNGQWFIAAVLALLLGSLVAFLMFNFPPASVFMGDGGSLVVGFVLGFLTIRTTYIPVDDPTSGWYGVFMPLIILAVPLYDFCSVILIRISQGRNPLVGDRQHFSHRFVGRGLTPTQAVFVIGGCTLAIGLGGIHLSGMSGRQALFVGLQTVVILGVLALYEHASGLNNKRGDS